MLAGEPPFTGPTAQAMIARRLTESPRPLRELRDTVPESVAQAALKALARSPADRFATAAEFARALSPRRCAPGATGDAADGPASAGILRRGARGSVPPLRLGSARLPPRPRRALRLAAPAWRHGPRAEAAPKLLAVLPFENLGDSQRRILRRRHHRRGPGQARDPPRHSGDRQQQRRPVQGNHQVPAGDREGARRLLSPARQDPLGRRAGRTEPGTSESRAGAGAGRGRRDDQVAARVRRLDHRRLPGAGRHRRAGGAGAQRGARGQYPGAVGGEADARTSPPTTRT